MLARLCLPLMFTAAAAAKTVTLLVLLDGLRHDYLDDDSKFRLTNLRNLSSSGVLVPLVKPVFPSTKYPNLASLATGAYADEHDVLDSEVYDQETKLVINSTQKAFWNKTKSLGTIWDLHNAGPGVRLTRVIGLDSKDFLFGKEIVEEKTEEAKEEEAKPEPPETPATNTGEAIMKPDHTGQIESRRILPSHLTAYALHTRWQDDLLKEVEFFLDDANATDNAFATIYLDEPGRTATGMGPDAVQDALEKVDGFVWEIKNMILKRNMEPVTNWVVASLPGYMHVQAEDIYRLEGIEQSFEKVGMSPVWNIIPSEGIDATLDLFSSLQSAATSSKKFRVFTKNNVPETLHYGDSSRVESIVAIANPGCTFSRDYNPRVKQLNEEFNRTYSLNNEYGFNGYEPGLTPKMSTSLIVSGPAFRANVGRLLANDTANDITTIDVFALLCDLTHTNCNNVRSASRSGVSNLFADHVGDGIGVKDVIDFVSSPDHLPVTASLLIAGSVILLSVLCIMFARRRHRMQMAQQGFRYSQVRHNRRLSEDSSTDDMDDKRGLLANSGGGGPAAVAAETEEA